MLDDTERLFVVPEAVGQKLRQCLFASVAERCMSEVVAECDRFGEVLVQCERAGDRAGDLLDLDGVRHARDGRGPSRA